MGGRGSLMENKPGRCHSVCVCVCVCVYVRACVVGGDGRGVNEIFQQESQRLVRRARNKNPTLTASSSLI